MFCTEFILPEILKYKLNNLHVLIFFHVDCFYFACYNSILLGLLGYHNIMRVQWCLGFRKFGGGGGGGRVWTIFVISRGGSGIFRIQGV